MINDFLNFIIANKDFCVIILSSLTLLFSIFTFINKSKTERYKENISNLGIILKNFYSPILVNAKQNKQILIDSNISNFFYENSFLIDKNITLLINELIKLECNPSLNSSRSLMSKYKNTRKYFISQCTLIYEDFSKLYRIEAFSFNGKYFLTYKFRWLISFLDSLIFLSCFLLITYILLIANIDFITTITIMLASGFLWFCYRPMFLSLPKRYVPSKFSLSIINIFGLYLYGQPSQEDCIYINIFTKKKLHAFAGFPIYKPSDKFSPFKYFSIYKIHKKMDYTN